MIEVVYFTLFAMIALFVYNVYLLFFRKDVADIEGALNKWKISLLLFIISLIVFFLYFGFTFNSIQQTQTINLGDGSPVITYSNNYYLDALSFFPMIISMLFLNFFFFVANVFLEFKVFGRTRMRKSRV